MLNIIKLAVSLLSFFVLVVYMFFWVKGLKTSSKTIKNIKRRIILSGILCLLFGIKIFINLFISKSDFFVGLDVLCLTVWIFDLFSDISDLRNEKIEVFISSNNKINNKSK